VAACVLKAFYRELPQSLLPETIFNELITLQGKLYSNKMKINK
jgi:hypothetical protein